ncbi:MAG: hypothetical protein N0C81_02105 [Candidatus Thiodiazotropha lotti]|nr:hypothetical protein [Candidatus Thiodiazotropha lotti]MCG8005043.1 hypothetical protein [Candidatus Thiodiazotropha lotti]MCG8006427.1 hypothetical protein [Candidatus Thiodiazotropha lotti]MCW4188671.1 hypothetical protein [Candidatus Thiodiazotropha lotti]MCW4194008.1 hypothetical protein [Candidatus Thiodiazotropha lotti]
MDIHLPIPATTKVDSDDISGDGTCGAIDINRVLRIGKIQLGAILSGSCHGRAAD